MAAILALSNCSAGVFCCGTLQPLGVHALFVWNKERMDAPMDKARQRLHVRLVCAELLIRKQQSIASASYSLHSNCTATYTNSCYRLLQ